MDLERCAAISFSSQELLQVDAHDMFRDKKVTCFVPSHELKPVLTQEKTAELQKNKIKGKIDTEIVPEAQWYSAEEYHQVMHCFRLLMTLPGSPFYQYDLSAGPVHFSGLSYLPSLGLQGSLCGACPSVAMLVGPTLPRQI